MNKTFQRHLKHQYLSLTHMPLIFTVKNTFKVVNNTDYGSRFNKKKIIIIVFPHQDLMFISMCYLSYLCSYWLNCLPISRAGY